MSSKNLVATVLGAVAVAVAGCSKTQDTAPETRVFGNPPVIESVSFVVEPQSPLQCDFTDEMILAYFTCNGVPDVELDGRLLIGGTYTELLMEARVVDPESTSAQTDILLMGASFFPLGETAPEEHTLVMLDDGGNQQFPRDQSFDLGLDCQFQEGTDSCSCAGARYDLDSNDAVANDQLFTRHFAFVDNQLGSSMLGRAFFDCIQRDQHQFPQLARDAPTYQFQFDAVDRRGNIATWPEHPTVSIAPATAACSGDLCACCALFSSSGAGECADLPGMRSPTYFPNGYCIDLL